MKKTVCAIMGFYLAICLGGCSAGTSQSDNENDSPKSESLTTSAPDSKAPPVVPLTLRDVAQRAKYICRATITGVQSAREQYDPQMNVVMSRVAINISKVYKGELGHSIIFRAFGGELDGLPYYPSHFPQFHQGEDVILFLGDFYGGIFTGAHEAGKYTVANGHVVETGKTIEEFENKIKSSLQ